MVPPGRRARRVPETDDSDEAQNGQDALAGTVFVHDSESFLQPGPAGLPSPRDGSHEALRAAAYFVQQDKHTTMERTPVKGAGRGDEGATKRPAPSLPD